MFHRRSLSLWYPRHMMQYRVGLFFGGATLAGAFSGLLAFGISFMSGTAGLLGWSWIFVSGLSQIRVSTVADRDLVDHRRHPDRRSRRDRVLRYAIQSIPTSTNQLTSLSRPVVMVDFPHTAGFLTAEERAYIVYRKSMSAF